MIRIILNFILFVWPIISFPVETIISNNNQMNENSSQDSKYFQYNFNVGQDLLKLAEYDKAMCHYEKSRKENGELGWYSEYMIGKCYQLKGDLSNAFKYYESSFKRRPTRIEPLFDIAYYYFLSHDFSKAHSYLKLIENIAYPINDEFFVHKVLYQYKVKELLSIMSFAIDHDKATSLKYLDQVIFNREIDWDVKYSNLVKSVEFVENISNAKFIPIDTLPPLLCNWSSDRYKPCNPSIIKAKDGYEVIARAVNYVQWCPGHLIVDGSGRTKTKNMYIKYDKYFNKIYEKCVDEIPSLVKYDTSTQGLEDLRIFKFNTDSYFVATTCQLHPNNIPKICLGKFDIDDENKTIQVKNITLLHGPNFDRAEKNWMPFVVNEELLAIYSLSPYVIFRPNIRSGECPVFINKNLGYDFSRLSGSAPPIPFDDGYLLMVHEGIWNYRRYYLHRFFYLDKNFEIKKYSQPFTFKHKGIEMCCGMTIDHDENNLIMAIGLEDREAYLCCVDLNHIRPLLKDIAELKAQ